MDHTDVEDSFLTVAEVARTADCHRQTAKLTREELAAIGVAYYAMGHSSG